MSKPPRPIIPEAYYFITRTTYRRAPWFAGPAYAPIVVDQWQHYEGAYEFTLDAYCVMPDHYHVVINVGSKK